MLVSGVDSSFVMYFTSISFIHTHSHSPHSYHTHFILIILSLTFILTLTHSIHSPSLHSHHTLILTYSDERLEWEDFAQLPHGINQIRDRLETQDNVPLLVHLFTHSYSFILLFISSTDTPVLGMLDVMTEWGEGVMTLSNSSHSSNYKLFEKVDYYWHS